jgi:hypothetical protein
MSCKGNTPHRHNTHISNGEVSACIYHASYRQWLLPKGPIVKDGVLDNAISEGEGAI